MKSGTYPEKHIHKHIYEKQRNDEKKIKEERKQKLTSNYIYIYIHKNAKDLSEKLIWAKRLSVLINA